MPKRKRNAQSDYRLSEEALQDDTDRKVDTSLTVLGGLKDPTLNSRVSGDRSDVDEGVTYFKIPFNGKSIVCERRGGQGLPSLIFTHGAGGGIANPATRSFATGFATATSITCFQGTMNLVNRVKSFHKTIEHERAGPMTALGGRSMGARAAVLTALEMEEKPKALVLVSYPLMAGSKGEKREQERRERILTDLPRTIDVLFVIGSLDAQCGLEQLNELRENMKAHSWLAEIVGADHGMSIKAKNGVDAIRQMSGSVAAEWLKTRDIEQEYLAIEWNPESNNVSSTGWSATSFGTGKSGREKQTK